MNETGSASYFLFLYYAIIGNAMKKKEWLIIVLIAVLALGAIAFRRMTAGGSASSDPYADIDAPKTDAKGDWIAVVHRSRIIMYFDSGIDGEYTVEGNVGKMIIEVKNQKWHVLDVDCYDYTCKNMGWMDRNNLLPIICLPNDLVIVDAATAQNMTEEQ